MAGAVATTTAGAAARGITDVDRGSGHAAPDARNGAGYRPRTVKYHGDAVQHRLSGSSQGEQWIRR